jgi:hypothetical protein
MRRVFFSFAAKDRDTALPIIEAVERAGFWVRILSDPKDPMRNLKTADCAVVLWSLAATQSKFVQTEIQLTLRAWSSNELVFVALDDAELPLGLRNLPVVSLKAVGDARSIRSVIAGVRAAVAAKRKEERWELISSLKDLWTLNRVERHRLPEDPPSHHFFVSYSRKDEQTVDQLVGQITQLGYTVWIDRQSTGTERYAGPIVRAIRDSRYVALMCSAQAFGSDHVIREVYIAGEHKKPFIAFLLEPIEFPDDVLYFVSGFPRVPVASLDREQLRSEIARLAY